MKTWLVTIFKKSTPDLIDVEVVDADTSGEAASKVEKGPVRFFYEDEDHREYAGQGYLYEVKEL